MSKELSGEVRLLNSTESNNGVTKSAVDLSRALQKSMLRLKGEYMDIDGRQVNYENLRQSPAFTEYKTDVTQLQAVNLDDLPEQERKAFFINIYNALTIHGLAMCEKTPSSVLDVQQFWKRTGYMIAGNVLTLDDIEHGILRGNRPHPSSTAAPFSNSDPRLKLTLSKLDPRIHFALVCGAKSCPAINVYSANNLDMALDAATRGFCEQEVSTFTETSEIWLSKIFQWYRSDFGVTDVDVIRWILPYLSKEKQERGELLLYKLDLVGKVAIRYNKYDWSLNKSS